jgi:ornithine cyclodeaminase
MALIGNGAQAEFQVLAMKEVVGIDSIRLYDVDRRATDKMLRNLRDSSLHLVACASAEIAVEGAQIITTATADKQFATILTGNMIGPGVHINAIGGDCPGKTELHRDILLRADTFVEYPPQTWIEGEIQQMDRSYPITELWQVVAGLAPGRRDAQQITLFDSVGFAIEDFSTLQYVRECVGKTSFCEMLDMIADPDDPRDLYGMLERAR